MTAPVWQPARIGRPPLTSRVALLAAARSIGFRDLTVGKMAEAVGVKYSTFYRHFASLDALTAVLVDDVLETAAWPRTDLAWRLYLSMLATGLRGLVVGYPGLAEAIRAADGWFPERLSAAMRVGEGLLDAAGVRCASAAVEGVVALALADAPAESVELLLAGVGTRVTEARS